MSIWIIGPIIDNVFEPKYKAEALISAASATPAFIQVQKRYFAMEFIATLLFYLVIVVWLLFKIFFDEDLQVAVSRYRQKNINVPDRF